MYSEASGYARKSYGGNTQLKYDKRPLAGDSTSAAKTQRRTVKSQATARGGKITSRPRGKPDPVAITGSKMTPINISTSTLLHKSNQATNYLSNDEMKPYKKRLLVSSQTVHRFRAPQGYPNRNQALPADQSSDTAGSSPAIPLTCAGNTEEIKEYELNVYKNLIQKHETQVNESVPEMRGPNNNFSVSSTDLKHVYAAGSENQT